MAHGQHVPSQIYADYFPVSSILPVYRAFTSSAKEQDQAGKRCLCFYTLEAGACGFSMSKGGLCSREGWSLPG